MEIKKNSIRYDSCMLCMLHSDSFRSSYLAVLVQVYFNQITCRQRLKKERKPRIISQLSVNVLTWLHIKFGEPHPGSSQAHQVGWQQRTATQEDNVTKTDDHILADRLLKVHQIAEIVNLSNNLMGQILQEILGSYPKCHAEGC